MSWRTVCVPQADLGLLQVAISAGGGTITEYRPCPDGVEVTYVVEPVPS
jgi:hypothetical protein